MINEFNEYIKAKENTIYTISEFRFFPPFQCCFYELEEIKGSMCELHFLNREQGDFTKKIQHDKFDNCNKNNIELNKKSFFFLSAGLHPVNVFRLSEKNKRYQDEFSDIRNRIRALKAQEKFQKLTKDTTGHLENEIKETTIKEITNRLEKEQRTNIATLGILGSFIAFVSFTAGSLQAVKTIESYVIFAFVFCIAVASFAIIIKLGFNEIKNIIFEKQTNNLKKWVKRTIVTALIILGVCLGVFVGKEIWKEIQNKDTTEKNALHINVQSGNTVHSEGITIEEKTDTVSVSAN